VAHLHPEEVDVFVPGFFVVKVAHVLLGASLFTIAIVHR
jgi:hypothetical protein